MKEKAWAALTHGSIKGLIKKCARTSKLKLSAADSPVRYHKLQMGTKRLIWSVARRISVRHETKFTRNLFSFFSLLNAGRGRPLTLDDLKPFFCLENYVCMWPMGLRSTSAPLQPLRDSVMCTQNVEKIADAGAGGKRRENFRTFNECLFTSHPLKHFHSGPSTALLSWRGSKFSTFPLKLFEIVRSESHLTTPREQFSPRKPASNWIFNVSAERSRQKEKPLVQERHFEYISLRRDDEEKEIKCEMAF